MNNERLSILQQLGKHPSSNSEALNKTITELSGGSFSWVIDRIRESNEKMPTDFQDSHFYDKIENSFSVLKETIAAKQIIFNGTYISPKPIPSYGTVDLGEYNAFLDASGDDAVIVFNNGLLKLVEQLLTLFVKEVWLKRKNVLTPRREELLTKHFLDIMMSYYLLSDAYAAIPLEWCEASSFDNLEPDEVYNLESSFEILQYDEFYLNLEYEIRETTYLWIAAHEYAHYLLNHRNLRQDVEPKVAGSEKEQSAFLKQEMDADLLATIISMESESSLYTATGIYFALSCMYLSSFNISDDSSLQIIKRTKNILDYIKTRNDYFVSNYNVVDDVFTPKLQVFLRLIHEVENQKNYFKTQTDMHEYIYKCFKIQDFSL